MTQIKNSLGKSEISLIKNYCSRLSDEDLAKVSELLPQTIAGDRSSACAILENDKEIDRWLSLANGAEDFFVRVDSIGEFAIIELEERSKKKE
jgi:hypothetical protein